MIDSEVDGISTDGTSSDESYRKDNDVLNVSPYIPSIELPLRPLAVIVALIPAIACYVCILSTFYLQPNIVSNYTLAKCPGLHSGFPPVSYSIGVWEPQKGFWLLALLLHIPPNILFIMLGPQQWLPGSGRNIIYVSLTIEMLGILSITICHVDSILGFKVHAGLFGVWALSAIAGMIIMAHLQRITGLRHRNDFFECTFWLKLCVISLYILASLGISILYPLSQIICSLPVFVIFCICEYAVIGLNGTFWCICLYEFCGEFKSVRIIAVAKPNGKHKEVIVPKSIFFDQPS